MPNERNFVTHLLSVEEAVDRATRLEGFVISRAWNLWQKTLAIEVKLRAAAAPSDRMWSMLHGRPAELGVILKPFCDKSGLCPFSD
jgi:hypothetical protein